MYVQRITDWNTPQVTAADWNRLSRDVPFRAWQWYESWWRHYHDEGARRRRLYLLCVFEDSGRLVGAAPWYVERTSVGRRIVHFLGTGEVCSDYQTILCLPGSEDAVTIALAQWLCDAGGETRPSREDRWDTLRWPCVERSDVALSRLLDHLAFRGNVIHCRPAERCWRVALPETWEEYLATLSKSHRKQVRRVQRRLFQTGRAMHHEARTPAELERGMEILIDLHQRRRRHLGEPGCFASRRFTAFHREVAARMLELDALRLSWVSLDGKPVAAEYHLAGGRVVYGYQSGLDPAALDDEPGRLAAVATLKRAIETEQTAMDFLRGDEPYKAHWRAQPVPTVDVRVVRDCVAARVAHQAWLAGEGVKHWIKTGIDWTAACINGPLPSETG